MCAGASPVALGKEVSGLLTRPRDCLNSVHCSFDLGVDWMSAHSRDHHAALASRTSAFHASMATSAAPAFTAHGTRLRFHTRRARFMRQ